MLLDADVISEALLELAQVFVPLVVPAMPGRVESIGRLAGRDRRAGGQDQLLALARLLRAINHAQKMRVGFFAIARRLVTDVGPVAMLRQRQQPITHEAELFVKRDRMFIGLEDAQIDFARAELFLRPIDQRDHAAQHLPRRHFGFIGSASASG